MLSHKALREAPACRQAGKGVNSMSTYYGNAYSSAVTTSLQNLYDRLIGFLPNFIVAVIVLIVGWVVAVFVAKLVKQVLNSLKLDEVGDKLGLDELSSRAYRQPHRA